MTSIRFIPGLLCNQELFRVAIKTLKHTEASWNSEVLDITQYSTFDEVVHEIGKQLPPKTVLVGFSLGGWLAMHVAHQFVDKVSKLCLVSCTQGGLLAKTRQSMLAAIGNIKQGEFEDYINRSLEFYVTPAHLEDKQLTEALLTMMRTLGAEVAINQLNWLTTFQQPFDFVDQIKCPVLIVRGAEDTRISLEMHQQLAQKFPHARLEVIKNAAHFVPFEQPRQLALCLEQFIRKGR